MSFSPPAKRARGGDEFDADADAELEAMLRGASGAAPPPAAPGFAGGGGGGMGFGAGGGFSGAGGAGGFPGVGQQFQAAGLGGVKAQAQVEKVVSTMDFSKPSAPLPTSTMKVQKELVEPLMTPEHRRLLSEETGASAEWAPEEASITLSGSAEQIKRAQRLLARVMMHSHWGYSESKVRRLLKPKMVDSVLIRLSPMNTLKKKEKSLSVNAPLLSIGKDQNNDVVIKDALISRTHCILELDGERGAVYVLDCSTNGTFLNGLRLPSKTVGKVLLTHGDELALKDPKSGEQEFGYIVNINELHVKNEIKLEAPRRLLTQDEQSNPAATRFGKG